MASTASSLAILVAVFVALAALPACRSAAVKDTNSVTAVMKDDDRYPLPASLLIGTGSSSYQVEGAWNEDGKGESVFDYFYHNRMKGSPNADVGVDSYHKYKEDVKAIKDLKMELYRFSLAWSRIFPDGTRASLNQKGVDYYNNLIDELIANGIKPFITLFHFDYPQVLEDQFGGWTSPQMIDLFVDFSLFAFETFGDRVKHWVTLNEPHMHCNVVYHGATIAPGKPSTGLDEYKCVHNELVAHARVYRLFKQRFAPTYPDAVIGMTIETFFASPADNQYENIQAAERYNLFEMGIQADPIIFGDYPALVTEMVAKASEAQGYPESRLPPFTEEEKVLLKGSTDFIGLNAYFGKTVISGVPMRENRTSPLVDAHVVVIAPDFGAGFGMSMPKAFRGALLWLRDRYDNPPVFVTENGIATKPAVGLSDVARAAYHCDYLHELVDAVRNDGCNIIGMTAWSLLDGFEWGSDRMMGMVSVDLSDPQKPRKLKDSSAFYVKLMTDRKVPLVEMPTPDGPTTSAPGGPTTAAPGGPTTAAPGGPTTAAPGGPTTAAPGGPTTAGPAPGPAPSSTPKPKPSAAGHFAPFAAVLVLALAVLVATA